MNERLPGGESLERAPRTGRQWLRPMLLCTALGVSHPTHAAQSIDLTALSLESLLQLTIVGASKYEQKQTEVAAAVSVITRSEIKAFGWRTLAEALGSLPGLYTTYDRAYTMVGARGFGVPGDLTARLLITVNGNRINDPVYDAGLVDRALPVDIDLIERIEFIPGPGGAVYGQNAMLGVVNVITRTGADVGGTEVMLATQWPQHQQEVRSTWGRRLDSGVDVLLSASGMRARGEDRFIEYGATGVSGLAAGLDGERLGQLFARVAGEAWSAEFSHGSRRKDDPLASFFSDPLVPGQFNKDTYTLAQLQYNGSFAGNTLMLSGRLFAGSYRYGSQFVYSGVTTQSPAQSDWRGTELKLLSTAVPGHKLMAGLEAQENLRIDQATLDLSNPVNNVHIRGSGYRIGLYLQDEWTIKPTLTATLGARVDRNNVTGNRLSPRAALIWQATPATTFKALYGRAHRAPNAFERDYGDNLSQVANPALEGERIDNAELVVDHRVGIDLTVRASVYQWNARDIIVLGVDSASGLGQFKGGATDLDARAGAFRRQNLGRRRSSAQ